MKTNYDVEVNNIRSTVYIVNWFHETQIYLIILDVSRWQGL